MLPAIYRHEKHVINNQTDKISDKKIGTTYCLGCKNYTHNFKPEKVKISNKVLKVKLNGVGGRTT